MCHYWPLKIFTNYVVNSSSCIWGRRCLKRKQLCTLLELKGSATERPRCSLFKKDACHFSSASTSCNSWHPGLCFAQELIHNHDEKVAVSHWWGRSTVSCTLQVEVVEVVVREVAEGTGCTVTLQSRSLFGSGYFSDNQTAISCANMQFLSSGLGFLYQKACTPQRCARLKVWLCGEIWDFFTSVMYRIL